jgi:hypothetical protein
MRLESRFGVWARLGQLRQLRAATAGCRPNRTRPPAAQAGLHIGERHYHAQQLP